MNNVVLALLAIGLFLVGVFSIIFTMRRLRKGKISTPVALGIATLLIVAVSVAFVTLASTPSYDPSKDTGLAPREARLYDKGFNLLPMPVQSGYYYNSGTLVISDSKEYVSPPIVTRSGEAFHFSYMASGSGNLTPACRWEDQSHLEGGGGLREDRGKAATLNGDGLLVYFQCAAPNDDKVAYLRVVLMQAGGNAIVDKLRLAADNIRVEQWPAAANAALAFSFDWESAMGGPIHSRGMTQHDVEFANAQGGEMRQGANYLADIFARHNIHATFYATGYNLLDGSKQVDDVTYKWANQKNGWASDYWTTHGWYSDDPLSTFSSKPQWYFGDQIGFLRAAGHEIGTHTFGHLYVRGASPTELDADLTRWQAAANGQHLPPVTTFAFPWRSSNSVDQPYYDVLRKHGIASVTRLYERDLRFAFQFSVAPKSGGMLVFPDFLLGSGSAEEMQNAPAGEGVGLSVKSLDQARAVIDDDIMLGGVTSFWNHPLVAVDPTNQQLWNDVAAYAASQRDAGKLWIAPVGDIVARYNAVRSLKVIAFPNGNPADQRTLIADIVNPTEQPLTDVGISVDGTIVSALVGGKKVEVQPELAAQGRMIIGTIEPGKTLRVTVTVQQ